MPRRTRFACAFALAIVATLFVFSFATARDRQTVFGTPLGGDFPAFYVAGEALNRGAAAEVYDFAAQYRALHQLAPRTAPGESLPYAYPPFFTLLLRPFAALPYAGAYVAWVGFSVALFAAGFALVWKGAPERNDWLTPLLLLASFEPLAVECLIGGQTTAFGFFALAATLYFVRNGRPIAGGLALSLVLYKPTLLVLILPMLVVSRQFRVLCGFAVGAAVLAGVSWLAVGGENCVRYLHCLTGFASGAATTETVFRTFKYVDVRSFFRLLTGGGSVAGPAVVAVVCLPLLLRTWWRARDRDGLWAGAIAWTLVLNVYVPMYDTALVALALLLAGDRVPRWWVGVLWVTPWVSQHLAIWTGVQPMTVVLVGVAGHVVRGRYETGYIICSTIAGGRGKSTGHDGSHAHRSSDARTHGIPPLRVDAGLLAGRRAD